MFVCTREVVRRRGGDADASRMLVSTRDGCSPPGGRCRCAYDVGLYSGLLFAAGGGDADADASRMFVDLGLGRVVRHPRGECRRGTKTMFRYCGSNSPASNAHILQSMDLIVGQGPHAGRVLRSPEVVSRGEMTPSLRSYSLYSSGMWVLPNKILPPEPA